MRPAAFIIMESDTWMPAGGFHYAIGVKRICLSEARTVIADVKAIAWRSSMVKLTFAAIVRPENLDAWVEARRARVTVDSWDIG